MRYDDGGMTMGSVPLQQLDKVAVGDDAKRDRRTQSAPAAAKALALLGPAALRPLLAAGPYRLFRHFESGQRLPTVQYGEPIAESSTFTADELRRVGDFARAQKVNVPIRAGAHSAHLPDSPLTRGLRKIVAKAETQPEVAPFRAALEPHIELSSTSVPVAMHEIGHATRPTLGQAWRGFVDSRNLLGLARPFIALKALTPPDEDSSATKKFVYNHAPALMAATSLPTLLEEGRASMHALRGAREFGPGVAQALKELVPAYGTYVGAAAAPALAVALAQRLAKHLSERREGARHGTAEERRR